MFCKHRFNWRYLYAIELVLLSQGECLTVPSVAWNFAVSSCYGSTLLLFSFSLMLWVKLWWSRIIYDIMVKLHLCMPIHQWLRERFEWDFAICLAINIFYIFLFQPWVYYVYCLDRVQWLISMMLETSIVGCGIIFVWMLVNESVAFQGGDMIVLVILSPITVFF